MYPVLAEFESQKKTRQKAEWCYLKSCEHDRLSKRVQSTPSYVCIGDDACGKAGLVVAIVTPQDDSPHSLDEIFSGPERHEGTSKG